VSTPGVTTPVVIASIARERGITGVHTHVRQLRTYLRSIGEDAELVTPHSWAQGSILRRGLLLPLFGARVVLERVWGPANVWWYRSSHEYVLRRVLRRRLAAMGECTVYAQCPVSARAALAARQGPHQRVVLAVHFRISQSDEWADKGQIARGGRVFDWIRATEREVLTRVDAIVFVSSWGRAALREWFPDVDRTPANVLHNFVRAPLPQDVGRRRGHLVSVGNLEAVKNHRFLVQVLAAARDQGHRYSLDIFGQGVEHDRLLGLCDELGVREQVRLMGFQPDVQRRLAEYEAYVHASVSESLPLAVIEAMAAGLPVVCADAGGIGELYDDGVEGFFWPVDDVPRAMQVLVRLMEDPALVRSAGRAARARFERDYDAEVVAPRLLSFLTEAEIVRTAEPA
jgi:glycosyltransferase involved in cell wall biosynthesis